jgi:DNA polymerase III alpha subunit
MIEGYDLDRSYKYPKLYNNSEKVFKEKIMQGIKNRKLDERYKNKEYADRLTYEFNTMKSQGNIDYFLLEYIVLVELIYLPRPLSLRVRIKSDPVRTSLRLLSNT